MKMEDMPLSGPDNTKLEVSSRLEFTLLTVHVWIYVLNRFYLVRYQFVFDLSCRLWSMTSTQSWWKTPAWACVLRSIVLWSKATSSWMKRTRRAWRSSVGEATSAPFCSGRLVCLLLVFTVLFFQKLWTSLEWTYLDKCTISGKTKSVSVQTAKGW